MMPNLGWHRILSVLTIRNKTILMSQPDYYQLLDKLIVNQPLNIWKNKIRFTILHEMSLYLNKDFIEARFHMFDHLIYGQHEDKIRWMKIIEEIDKYLGELLGELFISRYFSFQSKERTNNLAKNLINVYHDRINHINWISNSTKEKALKKLQTINIKIGYPTKWKSYNDIYINRSSYFNSISNILQHNYRKKMKDLRKLVDRDEWLIPPQTVNAFYYPSFNEMIFPAAILQEPFFSFDADDALNYGAIGYVIGHELTHCFDDQGRKYDENGNLHLWWTPDDINAFDSHTEKLIKQYENYKILNRHINGRLTLGENIADLGGLDIAYQAFLRTKQAKDGILIDDLTPQQRFFLAFAKVWRVKTTNEKFLSDLKQETHAPAIIRINGPLSNMIEFYHTFNITKNDAMFRESEDRIVIW
jgi:putative endopeptidase